MNITAKDRKDNNLRKMYQAGELTADDFLQKLFSTNEADRRRKNIVKKNEKLSKRFSKV